MQNVDTFDFWGFKVWPVTASLFVNGYKGAELEARSDACVGHLAKHESPGYLSLYAIYGANSMIPESLLKDIKKDLIKNDCETQDHIDKAMLRLKVFKDGPGRGVADGQIGLKNPPS